MVKKGLPPNYDKQKKIGKDLRSYLKEMSKK
jgi:hypothetical protein